jgi:hypothetical protein
VRYQSSFARISLAQGAFRCTGVADSTSCEGLKSLLYSTVILHKVVICADYTLSIHVVYQRISLFSTLGISLKVSEQPKRTRAAG